jgi:hypothetical protein
MSTILYRKTTKRDIVNQSKPLDSGYRSRIRRGIRRLACWSGGWVAASALLAFGPKFLWNKAVVFTLLAVGLDVAVGVGLILANMEYIAELDELQRKVYLNALAIAAGVAVIAAVPYSVLITYHVIPFKADVSHVVMLMSVTFVVSALYGSRRYR